MDKPESLEEFYQRKAQWVPEDLRSGIGHFNLFRHEPVLSDKSKPPPYRRRDFYKIMLTKGNDIRMEYADKVVSIKKQAIFFSNPLIPYRCANLENIQEGVYCIFNHHFFHQFGDIRQYAVFQPAGEHVFELTDEQAQFVNGIYVRMNEEINSDYIHKYDALRNLVFELLHFAMKLQPASKFNRQPANASQRIATIFLELLERQFPIEADHPKVTLRSPSDFADQLNVHVNHLNRAVKTVFGKTTSQVIAERLLQEAKILLKHSQWNVSEIGYALGFSEVTHFNNFFKNWTGASPTRFRKG